ncbi:MAG: ABC transporter ATP-binding protein [Qingshengfaniella sp.]
MSTVVLSNVTCTYGSFLAVDDLNLTIESGEFLTLLGPSGCGKSTTLRMLAGLVKARTGTIRIGDQVVSDPGRGIFVPPEARKLGMVFQSYAIWPHMTVFDNVAYPLRIRRRPRSEVREKVMQVLELVEMAHLADRAAPDLSGGQQQRIAIARALVFEPDVLLLDEPLSNLDARLRTQMGDEFRALQQRLKITAIYVTHDQSEAMSLSDRVVLMSGGAVLQDSPPREIYQHPQSRKVAEFFGSPNFVTARVERAQEIGDNRWRLDVLGEGIAGQCLAGFCPAVGEPVNMVVRPENFVLSDDPDFAGMRFAGRVQGVTFRGPMQSVVLDTGIGPLNVEVPSLVDLNGRGTLTVGAPMSAAWALPAGA